VTVKNDSQGRRLIVRARAAPNLGNGVALWNEQLCRFCVLTLFIALEPDSMSVRSIKCLTLGLAVRSAAHTKADIANAD